jgi:hypothetical protein
MIGQPKYILIRWDNMAYHVVHYSHNWNDVQRMLSLHPDCTIMINYEEVKTIDGRQIVRGWLEKLITNIQKAQSK